MTSWQQASALDTALSTVPALQLRAVSRQFSSDQDLVRWAISHACSRYRRHVVYAVDNVDLTINEGEIFGLVGESGCGKSTLGRMIAGILKPTAGSINFRGTEVAARSARKKDATELAIQMIFQDPFASLNPRMRVEKIVGQAPLHHGIVLRKDVRAYVNAQLRRVGLDPSYKDRFPHQLSGGQRQRVGIARALAVKPKVVVCDEAVASLDVSIQAQILNLFRQLREELSLTYLFISHDLGVVRYLSDRIAIMYLGRIVEQGPADTLLSDPNHPYTVALLNELPRLDSRHRRFAPIKGEIPSSLAPPSGCHFHPRCPHAMPRCRIDVPALREIAPGRLSACHLNDIG